WIQVEEPVVFLNLGGVGNLTWVDPQSDAPENPGVLLAFDTGPANAPLSDEMMRRRGVAMDENGALARTGNVDAAVIGRFMDHPYFGRMAPKSLDRNDFAEVLDVTHLSDADAAATMTAAIAMSVAVGIDLCPAPPLRVLVTGGGRKNETLMDMLRAAMRCPVDAVEEVGLDGDMLEAQAFAYLAVRVARGIPTSCPTTTGVPAVVGGGIVSEPN
ncbi:MAG: anhydro-N-acetylmuramic acid kinase, partial [Pseudomonadota bacterium]